MDRNALRNAVAALVPSAIGAEGWVRVVCPNCEAVDGKRRDNMTINLETGYFQCWRCHVEGGTGDGREVGSYARACRSLHIMRMDDTGTPPVPLPEGFTSLADPELGSDHEALRARAYLLRRGVTMDTATDMGLGIVVGRWKYADRIVVPVAVDGHVCGFTARLYLPPERTRQAQSQRSLDSLNWRERLAAGVRQFDPNEIPKYLYPKGMSRLAMLNRDALELVTTVPLALVEGAMDCLPHYPDALAFLGKPTPAQLEWVAHHARRPVVMVVDGDAWREGAAAARKLRELSGGSIQVGCLKLPAGTDPGITPPAKMRRLVAAALHLPYSL